MSIYFIIGVFSLVFLDQLTKSLVVKKLKPIGDIPIIKDIFHLTYVENKGAAFGILQGKRMFFIITTIIVTILITLYYHRLPSGRKYNIMRISLILLAGGAIGNLIDRIRLNHVVDFLYFKLIDFPVFNIADICVVIGVIMLSIIIIITPDADNVRGSI